MRVLLKFLLCLGSVLLAGCGAIDTKLQTCPEFIPKSSVWDSVVGQTSSSSYTGLAFFRDELYVGSASGLQRYQGREFVGSFRCRTGSWDSFEDVSVDTAHENLWVFH